MHGKCQHSGLDKIANAPAHAPVHCDMGLSARGGPSACPHTFVYFTIAAWNCLLLGYPGLAAAAAMYTHAWRSGDAIKALASWSNGLDVAAGGAAKYAIARQ